MVARMEVEDDNPRKIQCLRDEEVQELEERLVVDVQAQTVQAQRTGPREIRNSKNGEPFEVFTNQVVVLAFEPVFPVYAPEKWRYYNTNGN